MTATKKPVPPKLKKNPATHMSVVKAPRPLPKLPEKHRNEEVEITASKPIKPIRTEFLENNDGASLGRLTQHQSSAKKGIPPPTQKELVIPVTKKLSEFLLPIPDSEEELLRHRFLCRGGGLLLTGPTGIGKSAFTMQCMMQWALGYPAFGIEPVRPLKIVLIQAENDEGDIAEFRDGVCRGLELSEQDSMTAAENIIVCTHSQTSSLEFSRLVVEPLLIQHRPDLLIIDPALAYLGGETNSQKDVGEFLRVGLTPLIREYGAGVIVVHHTNKPPRGKEKPDWVAGDLAYLGSGSAEWANWPRAVIAIRATGEIDSFTGKPVFELCASKRGAHLRWKDDLGNIVISRKISHSREAGVICWHELDECDIEKAGSSSGPTIGDIKEEILRLLSEHDCVEKKDLIESGVAGAGAKKIRECLRQMLKEGILTEVQIKRSGSHPQINVALNNGVFEAE